MNFTANQPDLKIFPIFWFQTLGSLATNERKPFSGGNHRHRFEIRVKLLNAVFQSWVSIAENRLRSGIQNKLLASREAVCTPLFVISFVFWIAKVRYKWDSHQESLTERSCSTGIHWGNAPVLASRQSLSCPHSKQTGFSELCSHQFANQIASQTISWISVKCDAASNRTAIALHLNAQSSRRSRMRSLLDHCETENRLSAQQAN